MRNSTFFTNTVWYVLLGLFTVLELAFVLARASNPPHRRRLIAFYLTILGLALFFESAILVFLDAYTYSPLIIKNPPLPFDDVLAGNLFSQSSIAATALIVAVSGLAFRWMLLISVVYGLTEELFLALGVYRHYWYQTWMTVLLLPILFSLAKKMWAQFARGIKPAGYYADIFLALFPLNIVLVNWSLMLLRLQDFSLTLFSDPITSRHSLVLVQFLALTLPAQYIYFKNPGWARKALTVLAVYGINYVGYRLGLILIRDGWFLPVTAAIIFGAYCSVWLMDYLYGRPLTRRSGR